MADQLLNVTIKFNKDTGALDVVKQELDATKVKAGQVATANKGIADSLGSVYKIAVAYGALRFLQSSLEEAIKFEKSLNSLMLQMQSLGIATGTSRADILKWADAIQKSTTFTDSEAVGALNKFIGVTKDLASAQRLSQLAFDISYAKGKDQNEIINMLAKAYAGSAMGVKGLKMELGDTNLTINDTNHLLRMAEERFGGSAQKIDSNVSQLTILKNQYNSIKQTIGSELIPILVGVGDVFQDMISGWQVVVTVFTAQILNIIDGFKFLGKAMSDVFKGRFSEIKEDFNTFKSDVVVNQTAMKDQLKEIALQGTKDYKGELDKRGEFNANASKQSLSDEKAILKEKLKAIQDNTAIELNDKSLLIGQKKRILENELAEEIRLVEVAVKNKVLTEREGQAMIENLTTANKKKLNQLDQQYADDSAQRWERYTNSIVSQNQILEKQMESIFDGISGGFGDSIAKMIVYGDDFKKSFGDAMKALAVQVIAEIIKMEIKMLAFKALGQGNMFSGSIGMNVGGSAIGGAVSGGAGAIGSGVGAGATAGGTAGIGGVVSGSGAGAGTGATGGIIGGAGIGGALASAGTLAYAAGVIAMMEYVAKQPGMSGAISGVKSDVGGLISGSSAGGGIAGKAFGSIFGGQREQTQYDINYAKYNDARTLLNKQFAIGTFKNQNEFQTYLNKNFPIDPSTGLGPDGLPQIAHQNVYDYLYWFQQNHANEPLPSVVSIEEANKIIASQAPKNYAESYQRYFATDRAMQAGQTYTDFMANFSEAERQRLESTPVGMLAGNDPLNVKAQNYIYSNTNTGELKIYPMAEGGIVKARPGGTMTILGEAGEDEAVVPLSKAGAMGMGNVTFSMPTTINIQVQPGTTAEMAESIVNAVAEQLKRKTPATIAMALRMNNLTSSYSGRSA